MAEDLPDKTVAFLVAPEGVEQIELTQPWEAVRRAGAKPHLLSTRPGRVRAFEHLDPADTFMVDRVVEDAEPSEYDALVLPGGVANPDQLRTVPEAVDFVRRFVDSGRPVAAICHAPWTLVEAGVLPGRRVTSYPSLATDVRNAGAQWVDEQLVVDHNLITSRDPGDLPAFDEALVASLATAP